jgi:hypothetical protein
MRTVHNELSKFERKEREFRQASVQFSVTDIRSVVFSEAV